MNTPSQRFHPDTQGELTEVLQNRCVNIAPTHLYQLSGAACLKTQANRFQPGHELDAWLCVLAEITQQPQRIMQEYLYASGK